MDVVLFGVGKGPLTLPSGRVWDFGAPDEWERLVSALTAQVPIHRPPLLWMHDLDREEIGRVTSVLRVDGDQLRDAGVPADVADLDQYLLFRAKLNAEGERLYAEGKLRATSIGMGRDVTDERGRVWPWYLQELSVVTTPHVTQQPHADELMMVGLCDARGMMVTLSAAALASAQEAAMADNEKKDEMGELKARLEAAERERDEALAKLAEYDERMAKLERDHEEMAAARLKAEAFADLEAARVECAASARDHLVKLYAADRDAYAALKAALPRRGDNRRIVTPSETEPRKPWLQMSQLERLKAKQELMQEHKIDAVAANDLAVKLYREGGR
jgi:hypothetical protein